MLKTITPGCLALAINPQLGYCGIVTAVKLVKGHTNLTGRRCSGCRSKAEGHYWHCDGLPGGYDAAASCVLYPLDGDEEESIAEEKIGELA